MCVSCGCGDAPNDHGDPRNITIADLQAAADAAGISLVRAAANILQTVTGTLEDNYDEPEEEEQRFVLGVAYQPGRDPRIAKGLDGGRDWMSPRELERAAWGFMLDGQQHGLFHVDGSAGVARTVENYVYRNPVPWVVGDDLFIRKGTWLQGLLLDDAAWRLHRQGKINGLSPQGVARRRRAHPA